MLVNFISYTVIYFSRYYNSVIPHSTTVLSIKIATGNYAIVDAVIIPPTLDDIVIPTNTLPITPILFLIF